MSKSKIVEADLSYKLTGLFFKVHNKLGRFCREKQYADAFEKLLHDLKIPYVREFHIKNLKSDSPNGNIVDFLIDSRIILDFKAKSIITKADYIQMQRYLGASDIELGLIVNFRNHFLKPKRVLNPRLIER